MRTVIVTSGGPRPGETWRKWARPGDRILGANGGAAQALAFGLVPDVVIGDMDSLGSSRRAALEAHGCRFVVHPRAKDETDLELALTFAAAEEAKEIVILGALGGRLDHTLANLLLLALPCLEGRSVRIIDGPEQALLLRGGEAVELHGRAGDLVSLLPLGGDAHGVTATGLAWPLVAETLRFAFSRGVSNEMTGTEARLELKEGFLCVVHRSVRGENTEMSQNRRFEP